MYLVFRQILGLLIGPPVCLALFGNYINGIIFGPIAGLMLGLLAEACYGTSPEEEDQS